MQQILFEIDPIKKSQSFDEITQFRVKNYELEQRKLERESMTQGLIMANQALKVKSIKDRNSSNALGIDTSINGSGNDGDCTQVIPVKSKELASIKHNSDGMLNKNHRRMSEPTLGVSKKQRTELGSIRRNDASLKRSNDGNNTEKSIRWSESPHETLEATVPDILISCPLPNNDPSFSVFDLMEKKAEVHVEKGKQVDINVGGKKSEKQCKKTSLFTSPVLASADQVPQLSKPTSDNTVTIDPKLVEPKVSSPGETIVTVDPKLIEPKQSKAVTPPATPKASRKSDPDTKQLQCPHCPKIFSRKENLTKHERIHLGLKPFECPQCNKRFSDQSNLRKHEKIHSEVKEFECKTCAKSFHTKQQLSNHELVVHEGVKRFGCTTCDKRFSNQSNLQKHKKKCT